VPTAVEERVTLPSRIRSVCSCSKVEEDKNGDLTNNYTFGSTVVKFLEFLHVCILNSIKSESFYFLTAPRIGNMIMN
jgi:hypothetical protein